MESHYRKLPLTLNGRKFIEWKDQRLTTFHRNGQIAQIFEFKDGLLNGIFKSYNIRGIEIISSQYQQGLRHGKEIYRDGEGKVESVQYWKMGIKYEPVCLCKNCVSILRERCKERCCSCDCIDNTSCRCRKRYCHCVSCLQE